MSVLVLAILLLALVVVARLGWSRLGSPRQQSRSVDRYGQAMETLRSLSERTYPARPSPRSAPVSEERPGSAPRVDGVTSWVPASPRQESRQHNTVVTNNAPPVVRVAADVIGLDEPAGHRESTVEANARLTATTGLVLIVLLFLEGLTIPFIVRLVSWHILIGLVLIPPLLVKTASVTWRFGHYYLGDPRFRRAGPPHPLLRALGPLVMFSTLVVFGSGVILWLAGPADHTMFLLHQLSFVAWFVVIALHIAGHLLRATRLAAADAKQAKGGGQVPTRERQQARGRRRVVVASLVVGLLVGLAGRSLSTSWTGHGARPAPHAISRPVHR
ncbi:MAG: cytochrome b/b6 domain-containing protein [Acidimicrobiales bacterium]